MSFAFTEFFFSLGAGGIGGFVVGYATKKILKIVMVFLGLYLISLLYLMQIEVIKIDFKNLFLWITDGFSQTINFLSGFLVYLPITASFLSGFTLGIIKG